MASKKAATSRKQTRKPSAIAGAIKLGQAQAQSVIAFRTSQRKKRTKALAGLTEAPRAIRRIPPSTLEGLGSRASNGLLIAEGDSWFDYPMHDVLSMLEDDYGYDVESVAHKGDCVEDMAYSGGQFEEFARRLEKLLRQNRPPDVILISGGGNDIAGDEFAILLNHAASGLSAINEDVVRGVIDVRLRRAYASLLGGLNTIVKQYLSQPIPILTHGYDYPVPDGRGFLGGWGPLPGPWLRPGFHKKGHTDDAKNLGIMRDLIDSFNKMLQEVSAAPEFKNVHYLDLRKTLNSDRKDWANELHPTERGFAAVTAKFASAIAPLLF